jgi:hypothetical protein
MGTQWGLKGNPTPPQNLKRKKARHLDCMGLSIGCMKFIFPKEFTIFGLG